MRGKNTYPSLLGLPASESFAVQLTNNALKVLETFDNKADPLRAVARYVIQRNR
jgi:geranylgeranyl diphosphate synthase type II